MQPLHQHLITALPLTGVYFITGTDTEIGKTTTTCQLIKRLAEQGKSCYAIKPITAGVNELGASEDAEQINQFANVRPPISAIAPIVLATPCSPHIASDIENIPLTATKIVKTIQQTLDTYPADCVLIEGAGGWFTPINHGDTMRGVVSETLADVALRLEIPIILVVGIKLGCLNHAVLTLQAIWQSGGRVAMVVFNSLGENTAFEREQIDWLQTYILQSLAKTTLSTTDYPLFYVNPFLSESEKRNTAKNNFL